MVIDDRWDRPQGRRSSPKQARLSGQGAGVALVLLLLMAAVLPLAVPVPPLEGVTDPRNLADPDSRFAQIGGLTVHYKQTGTGGPLIFLLHGFAANLFSWREVMQPLAAHGTVVAFDRPAFGLTSRPMPGDWSGESPYSLVSQAKLTVDLMDYLGFSDAVLIGNSAGGTVALQAALTYPSRVRSLVLVDAAVYSGGGLPDALSWLLATPQARRVGPFFVRDIAQWGKQFGRSAWHDPSRFTEAIWAGYTVPLRATNWDRALWEVNVAGRPSGLPARLGSVKQPVLVITGDDDRIVPTAQSLKLAAELPGSRLVVIPECGHVPQEEKPAEFLSAVGAFLP